MDWRSVCYDAIVVGSGAAGGMAAKCHLYVDDLDHPYATEPGTAFNWIRSRHAGGRTLVWSRFALRWADEELLSGHADGASPPWPIAYRDRQRTALFD